VLAHPHDRLVPGLVEQLGVLGISPPPSERKPALKFDPKLRLRTVSPATSPNTRTISWPGTSFMVETRIGNCGPRGGDSVAAEACPPVRNRTDRPVLISRRRVFRDRRAAIRAFLLGIRPTESEEICNVVIAQRH
jgi:hypothetical protein